MNKTTCNFQVTVLLRNNNLSFLIRVEKMRLQKLLDEKIMENRQLFFFASFVIKSGYFFCCSQKVEKHPLVKNISVA